MKLLYVKRRLFQHKINITGLIVNGIVHHAPKATILAQIKKEVDQISRILRLDNNEIHDLYISAVQEYDRISKKTFSKLRKIDKQFGKKEDYKENLLQRQNVVYHTVRKTYIESNCLEQERNRVAYRIEFRTKHDAIYGRSGLIQEARSRAEEGQYSPFFLASSHPKPAKDHADWEGKMYYDEDYKKFITDESVLHQVESYIKNRKVHSVQWVLGAPVFLVTRRNCKHYLKNIPLQEVLRASPKSLVKKHNMIMPEEVPITEEIRYYRAYYERYKTDTALSKIIQSEELKKDMKKDHQLLNKWTILLNSSK